MLCIDKENYFKISSMKPSSPFDQLNIDVDAGCMLLCGYIAKQEMASQFFPVRAKFLCGNGSGNASIATAHCTRSLYP